MLKAIRVLSNYRLHFSGSQWNRVLSQDQSRRPRRDPHRPRQSFATIAKCIPKPARDSVLQEQSD